MPSPDLNEPLMRAVVDRVIADPDSLDMTSWGKKTSCNTFACLAGHTVLEADCKIVWLKNKSMVSAFYPGECSEHTVGDVAQRLLGLSDKDAHDIFHGYYKCVVNHERVRSTFCSECGFHEIISPREIIQNISKVTGLEFKIPDDLL